jgi:hypothetical protein
MHFCLTTFTLFTLAHRALGDDCANFCKQQLGAPRCAKCSYCKTGNASRSSSDLKNRINENGQIEAYCRRLLTDRVFLQDEILVLEGLSAILEHMHNDKPSFNIDTAQVYEKLKREEASNGEKKSQSGEYEDFLEIGTLIADAVREARRIAPVANGFTKQTADEDLASARKAQVFCF